MRPFLRRLRLDNYLGFALLMAGITVAEELSCYLLGCTLAQPVLWVDLLWATSLWLVWGSVWYLFLARRYAFQEWEALLMASLAGVLFELASSGFVLRNPLAALVLPPIAVVT